MLESTSSLVTCIGAGLWNGHQCVWAQQVLAVQRRLAILALLAFPEPAEGPSD